MVFSIKENQWNKFQGTIDRNVSVKLSSTEAELMSSSYSGARINAKLPKDQHRIKLREINVDQFSPVKTPTEEPVSGSHSISSETGLLKPSVSQFEGQIRVDTQTIRT